MSDVKAIFGNKNWSKCLLGVGILDLLLSPIKQGGMGDLLIKDRTPKMKEALLSLRESVKKFKLAMGYDAISVQKPKPDFDGLQEISVAQSEYFLTWLEQSLSLESEELDELTEALIEKVTEILDKREVGR